MNMNLSQKKIKISLGLNKEKYCVRHLTGKGIYNLQLVLS
jgi:hypothetical protein